MSKGDKSSYTDKQKRQAKHIEDSYEKKGVSKKKQRNVPGAPLINKIKVEKRINLCENGFSY